MQNVRSWLCGITAALLENVYVVVRVQQLEFAATARRLRSGPRHIQVGSSLWAESPAHFDRLERRILQHNHHTVPF
jgi:hypothetical protein